MRLQDFDYSLPPSFIAQTPIEPRDASRLLVLNRAEDGLHDHRFRELAELLSPGDLLVFNDTRVIPGRLAARKRRSGGKVELLLLRRIEARTWEALVGGSRVGPGTELVLDDRHGAWKGGAGHPAAVSALVAEDLGGPRRVVHFSNPITPVLETLGEMPLPPYIHERLRDPERYQTVYSRTPGSAAAPTAGLHFTSGLLATLRTRGVETAFVTLHVGLDTFAPIAEPEVEGHVLHSEWMSLGVDVAEKVRRAHQARQRVVAVGTTSVRALETAGQIAARNGGPELIDPWEGMTRLYIYPGHRFRVVDAMITNFHLPRSTLLVMVSAFAGRERILGAYAEAQRMGYRFYSFGDAMLIL